MPCKTEQMQQQLGQKSVPEKPGIQHSATLERNQMNSPVLMRREREEKDCSIADSANIARSVSGISIWWSKRPEIL